MHRNAIFFVSFIILYISKYISNEQIFQKILTLNQSLNEIYEEMKTTFFQELVNLRHSFLFCDHDQFFYDDFDDDQIDDLMSYFFLVRMTAQTSQKRKAKVMFENQICVTFFHYFYFHPHYCYSNWTRKNEMKFQFQFQFQLLFDYVTIYYSQNLILVVVMQIDVFVLLIRCCYYYYVNQMANRVCHLHKNYCCLMYDHADSFDENDVAKRCYRYVVYSYACYLKKMADCDIDQKNININYY